MSVTRAAGLPGLSVDAKYGLVFSRQLHSVEAESGRRVIPLEAIDAWKRHEQAGAAVSEQMVLGAVADDDGCWKHRNLAPGSETAAV